ncbi:MAG TPA: TonB family protein [Thermoanaerobaculia bacterium]
MSSILVLEQEPRYIERIHTALGAEGWRVRMVHEPAQALQAAAAETPDLVIVSAAVSGVEAVASSLSRSAGGPGVLGLLPEQSEAGSALEADEILAKPFTDQDLQTVVRRAVLARRAQGPPPQAAVAPEARLTSQDIFGDVLAEVEGLPEAPAAAPPPRPAPAPAAAPIPASIPTPARTAPHPPPDADLNRRLEQTLSGVFGPDLKRAPSAPAPAKPAAPAAPAPAAPPRKPERTDAGLDIDAMLNKTLSNLEIGSRPKPAAPAPPPQAPAAPVQESTAVRRPGKTLEMDISALEELARPRRPAPPREAPREGTASGAPAPTPPRPEPVPAQAAPAPAAPPAAIAPLVFPDLPDLPEPPALLEEPEEPPVLFAGEPPAEPPAEPVAAAPVEPPAPPVPARPEPEPVPPAEPVRALQDFAATQRIPIVTAEDEGGDRFGQYTLLEKIAVGGMAEVWKARMRGVEGFQKTVAIKRILPHMTDNSEFIGMFIDEAKLAAQLSHPNIVHIYDLGKIGRDYYIAMEYVEGRDLRSLLNASRRKGHPLPLGLALLIAARLASALDYAHRKRDFEGRELGLVHRDVSPQNVLISHEGDVKLCDFGIAKAVSTVGQTQMGALKGKLQYMSPEQAWGRPVDARSDIFSLGAVLFEMVTGDRLFSGDSEMSVLESVRQGRIRSVRDIAPSVPPSVEEIVARALAHEPQNRFQSAGEMAQRIGAVLRELTPAPGPPDLASYLQAVMAPEPEVEAEEEISHFLPEPSSYTPPPVEAPPEIPLAEEAPPVQAVAPVGEVRVEESAPRSRRLLYAAIAALVVAVILTLFLLNRPRGGQPVPPAQQAPSAGPGATPAPQAPATAAPPVAPGAPVDLAGLVDQELAKKRQEQQKLLDEQVKQLEQQLADARKSKETPVPAPAAESPRDAAPPEPAPAAASVPEPAPAVAETTPAVQIQEPSPQPEPQQPQEREEQRAAAPEPAPEPEAPRVRPGDLVSMGPGVTPPELVSVPKAQYPPLARRLQVEGVVVVSVLVDENGQVQDARVIESVNQKVGFNEAALAAARGARYRPATKSGVRVKMWTRLRIPFKR